MSEQNNKLSIIIPVYNEKDTLLQILEKIKKVNLGKIKKEVILVDDASTDGTTELIKTLKDKSIMKFFHKFNQGKGAAVKTGIQNSTGNIIIIQDADLEYEPNEYPQLIKPILNKKFKVVYGSRVLKKTNKPSNLSFHFGGKLVTLITNLIYNSNLTDEPTCYKVFESNLIKSINIKSNRFEWEPEVTAKIIRRGYKIHEIPISYFPRKKNQGKKIKPIDGFKAILTLIKYRFKD